MTEQTEIAIDVGQIPHELKALAQWVVWRNEQPDPKGKAKKVPYDPKTGRRASITDPTTWADFETCCLAFEQGGYDGVGYVFTKNDLFCGIDLDHCINPETSSSSLAETAPFQATALISIR